VTPLADPRSAPSRSSETGARRLAALALLVLGVLFLGNGAWMLLDSARWFARVASATGAFNAHFVRDVGAAYAAAGAALVLAALRPAARAALAGVAGVFLGIHAVVHVVESASGALPHGALWDDFPGVHLPALLVLALALHAALAPRKETLR